MRWIINKYSKGFTIIESLIALLVLSLSLAPIIAMTTLSSSIGQLIENNLVGSMLAQEGIEIIRAMRDTNWLNNQLFDYGLVGTWLVESDTGPSKSPISASINDNPFLKTDPDTNLYNYTTGDETIFKRLVTVTKISEKELKVISSVEYQNRFGAKTITVEDHFFDWK
jgi:prepilin-type N-terminal cleavage/methylation domain-containing protein